mmetsp:Transcript_91533/g.182414  ORF Transcript_91533/g.182414 Transcript_91533/m.182414 type:complete len:86 (-) Transcript_91533:18-275(-)
MMLREEGLLGTRPNMALLRGTPFQLGFTYEDSGVNLKGQKCTPMLYLYPDLGLRPHLINALLTSVVKASAFGLAAYQFIKPALRA